ncbi:glucose-1-phosphate cytidylyltransferase [Azospirillum halopraeferens]|uniref:glucose-1-phosphate cytidylyltransferase n=1 Tax=Azospirillum halopraeferens TaxID=34010 RepID=UPI00042407FC|nr:glucose-1-phosphate cytidylyltransferase [Azospirillum halopraeferens]
MTASTEFEAVILCGGLGTRLREETEFRPKPMVDIGGRPILWHIMRHYRHFGVRSFVLCLGYKGDSIRDFFLNYNRRCHDLVIDLGANNIVNLEPHDEQLDWRVVLAETGAESMTGRRIVRALRHVRGNTFLATYGDGVADVDVDALIAHHRRMGRMATVTAVHPSSRFGELGLSGDIVHSFREKPQVDDGWINGGFFVFEKEAFADVDPAANPALEDGVLERLAERGELSVYRHHGFWQCMDTYREMQLLNELWASGSAPWRLW